MGHLQQNISQPLESRVEFRNEGGLVATPFTGSTNVAILLWTGAGARVGPPSYITETNVAADGTEITIFKPGVYEARLALQQATASDTFWGISVDVAAAGLTTTPTFANAGMLDVERNISGVAENVMVNVTATFVVGPEHSINGRILRFHAAASGDAAPANAFIAAGCYYSVRRINQAHS